MNQNDFRQMLTSRESHSDEHNHNGKRSFTATDLEVIKKLSTKKSKKKSTKPKNTAPVEKAEMESRPLKNLYRDRAAERRRGSTSDMIDANEYKHLDAEQSKFLGGDMEHTHLVKGLDYALLAQLKREKQKRLAEKHNNKNNSRNNSRLQKVETTMPPNCNLAFKSRMGRLVYFYACQQNSSETTTCVKSEFFLPGRMYYTFDLSSTDVESIPVSVQRSKEDCTEPDDVVSGIVDVSLIERVQALMVNKKKGKKLRKKKINGCENKASGEMGQRQDDREYSMLQVKAAAIDDDEDIFSDVGEYLPADQRLHDKHAKFSNERIVEKAGYFLNLSASITEKEEAARKKEEDAKRAYKETLQRVAKVQKTLELKEKWKSKELKMTGEADDYAEYQDISALADSDGEGDEKTKRQHKASDRKTEKDLEEMARRKKQKQTSRLTNDLEKINQIMLDDSKTFK